MIFSEEMVQKVWEKGKIIRNIDPNVWRKDYCGAWIKRSEHGNTDSQYARARQTLIDRWFGRY